MSKSKTTSHRTSYSTPKAFLINMIMVYIINGLCHIAFLLENWTTFKGCLESNSLSDLLTGTLRFDTSAILYVNVLYAVMMLFPYHKKESDGWQTAAKWVFVVLNSLCVVMNLADSVYYQYTGRRTTATVFSEFKNEGNLTQIFGTELLNHWYLVLTGLVMIAAMCLLYRKPKGATRMIGAKDYVTYYAVNVICFVLYIPLTLCGMRGGATTAVRPITISNANQYVSSPSEAALVLNTPFSMIRTIGKTTFTNPKYYTAEQLDRLYSPIHTPADSTVMRKRNVVVLIVESFGREYIGRYNEKLEGGKYKGYAPFIDSLYSQSLSFDYTFCNGRKSIDGMPSILSSIPMFIEPFFLTPASLNDVSGIAGELSKVGYHTAFFHGAENGSMGFQAFARATGFKEYYGRTEYDADNRFGGENDFDGTWAIWDEPFLQFYATKMSEMKQPFMTAVFTASSHHPFAVPEKYKDVYKEEGGNVIHKCIRYTDHALERFFDYASRQPWYRNTLFVFTSDHTNLSDHAEYKTDLGLYGAPILLFDPSGEITPGRSHAIAQQIDIMPTVLSYLGYKRKYVAFGQDLLTTPASQTWAVNYNMGIYQYVKGDYMLQFDGKETKAVYNIKKDWMLTKNLKGKTKEETKMVDELKAIIQSYMERIIDDKLIIRQ